ncbi:MAG: hypothetical protein LBU34_00645 [Planctomycetaceae bacterium]|nr:hypothetical protein [Planctomycetaceae bacterium]
MHISSLAGLKPSQAELLLQRINFACELFTTKEYNFFAGCDIICDKNIRSGIGHS